MRSFISGLQAMGPQYDALVVHIGDIPERGRNGLYTGTALLHRQHTEHRTSYENMCLPELLVGGCEEVTNSSGAT